MENDIVSENDQIKNVLIAARNLIKDPNKWTKHKLYATKDGFLTSKSKAEKFCALGALYFSDDNCKKIRLKAKKILDLCAPQLSYVKPGAGRNVVRLNDNESTKHKEIINLYNKAIRSIK